MKYYYLKKTKLYGKLDFNWYRGETNLTFTNSELLWPTLANSSQLQPTLTNSDRFLGFLDKF